MKKFLAVLISLCMVSLLAVPVFADANSDYIAAVKASLTAQLDSTYIMERDGTKRKLPRRD